MGVVRVAFIPDGALRTFLQLMRSNILRGFQFDTERRYFTN